jgi:CBS domain-containing protein
MKRASPFGEEGGLMALLARDIMEREVKTVDADMTLATLEDTLLRSRISGAPVVDRGEVVGVVTRSDVVRTVSLDRSLSGVVSDFYRQIAEASGELAAAEWKRAQGADEHLARQHVRDAMTPEIIAVAPETPIQDVARIMVNRHVHRLLVLSGKQLIGLISASDIMMLVADGRLRQA